MKVQKNIEVWLVKKRLPRPIDLVQYDTGIQLVFAVQDFTIPGGTTATLYVQKPSGKFVYQETGITVSGNTITIDLENQAITEHGNDVPYQVTMKNGTDLITTFAGIMRVEKSLKDAGATESKSVIAAFEAKTAEQIAEIEAAAQAQIEQIRNLYNTYATKTEAANAIKGNLTGYVVAADDVSPLEHNPDVWVHGKNLFACRTAKTSTVYGVTCTFQENSAEVILNGTATVESSNVFPNTFILPKGTYTASVKGLNAPDSGSDRIYLRNVATNEVILNHVTSRVSRTFTLEETAELSCSFVFKAASSYNNATVTVQIEQGETATDHEPYIDPSTVTVKRTSKNLIDRELMKSEATLNGVTITRNGDQITLNGTLNVDSVLFNTHFCHHGGLGNYYTLSCEYMGGTVDGSSSVCVGDSETVDSARQSWANIKMQNADNSYAYKMTKPFIKDLWFYAMAGVVFTNYRIRIQLEPGKEATDFETCNGAEYTPAADGTVSGITSLSPNMTILTDTDGAIVECEYNIDLMKSIKGERGLSIYLVNSNLVGSAEYYSFTDFSIPDGYVPKVNDLVLYKDGYLAYIFEVNEENQTALVASFGDIRFIGPKGEPGVSPTATVSKSGNTTTITITDANGTTTATVNDGEGGSSGGAQSDWNAAEGEPGHVLNRTHYSEMVIGTVLAETSSVFNEDEGAFFITDPIPVTVGEEYTVNWNGTEYTCVCGEFDMDGLLLQCLGNLGALAPGDDTGEPFFMLILPSEMAAEEGVFAQIMPLDGSTELTISITGMQETVTPIPEKYLPKPLFLYVDDTNYLCKQENLSEDSRLTYSELENAVLSGRAIKVVGSILTDFGLSTQYCPVIPWLFTEAGYGQLQVIMSASDTTHTLRTYYTAEYSATT